MTNSFQEKLTDELAEIDSADLRRPVREVASAQGARVELEGREVLNFSSNDYLGLANHPALKEAAVQAIENFGTGAGAARLISGSQSPHHELENALANFALDDWKTLRDLNASAGPISDLALRKPQLAEAIAESISAEAALEKAQEDLNRTSIRAPYDGMVQEKRADVGQYVNTGSQLALIFATDYAEIRLPITQRELALIDLPSADGSSLPLPVTLTSRAGTIQHTWQGLIVRSEGVFDSASRVLYVVAQVEDPYNQSSGNGEPLRIGTFVTANIQGRFGGALFTIPRHALQRGETLWIIDEQQKIYPRDVQIVSTDEEYAYVDGGLMNGDRYTITPIDQPLPGMPVRVNTLPRLSNAR